VIVLRVLGGAAVGVVAAAVGTVAHRGHLPWGFVASVALVLVSAVMARAWGGWASWSGHLVATALVVLLVSRPGPGGDVLLPAGQTLSWGWLAGAVAASALVGIAPARLFRDPQAREETDLLDRPAVD
jgi:hypothetical protein